MPNTWLVTVAAASSQRAMPKSITRGPSGPMSTFPGLKSRWITPDWWMADRAVAVCTASRSRADPASGPCSATTSCREGPSMYSLTTYGTSPSSWVSTMRAVQNGATRLAAATSRAKRDRARGSLVHSARSSLTATRSPAGGSAR